jgi:hypothetical protein
MMSGAATEKGLARAHELLEEARSATHRQRPPAARRSGRKTPRAA